jgi:peptidoglycan hydrolase CwlO-like protein
MSEEELQDYTRRVSENEDSAIRLLRDNIRLKNEIETLKKMIDEKDDKITFLKSKIKELEQDRDENYILRQQNPYSEYGISEKDFH